MKNDADLCGICLLQNWCRADEGSRDPLGKTELKKSEIPGEVQVRMNWFTVFTTRIDQLRHITVSI